MEKLKCMINYFRKRVDGRCADSIVTFTRRALTEKHLPHWSKSVKLLRNLRIDSKGTIEDVQNMGMLEVDFANAYIGGGVLGHGCVQEEIRFLICPELIISRFVIIKLLPKHDLLPILTCHTCNSATQKPSKTTTACNLLF
jgi:poly(ADP-ribose) glycohydrolase